MNKIIYSTVLVASVMAITSCNLFSKKDGAYSEKSSSAAGNIIGYTNLIVDMSNAHNSYLEEVTKTANKVEEGLKHPEDKFALTGVMRPFKGITQDFEKVKLEEPIDDLNKADHEFFKVKVGNYLKEYYSLKATNDRLHDYLTAQDYKDDKGAKGLLIVDSIRSKVEVAYTLKNELMKKVQVVADASEDVILQDSPLKDYIFAMKADIKSARELVDLLEENGDKFATISDKAKAQYDALEAANAKHAALNLDNAKKVISKDLLYKNFYDRMHTFLLDAKKILRDGNEKGTLTETNIMVINGDYDTLITSYNSFNS